MMTKVAIVTEALWSMGGSNRVLECLAEIFPNSDIYSLFGSSRYMSQEINKHRVEYSFLNRIPFIHKIYRYTFFLWPIAVEQFDLSQYDLVISISSSVSHGAITSVDCKHIVYVNTPMRYAWDLKDMYNDTVKFGFLKRITKEFFLTFIRAWDVAASDRPDILISNSKFVSRRIKKYWDKEVDCVIYPPVSMYKGRMIKSREEYFVSGAPFEPNKRGDFLLECACVYGFDLKVIGYGSMFKKLRRKYSRFSNIEFLGKVSEEEKWRVLSRAKGYIVPGIEDYGIFPVEAISCGTPVLAYYGGGSVEIVKEGSSGMFFNELTLESFKSSLDLFFKKEWDCIKVRNSMVNVNSKWDFKKKILGVLVE